MKHLPILHVTEDEFDWLSQLSDHAERTKTAAAEEAVINYLTKKLGVRLMSYKLKVVDELPEKRVARPSLLRREA